MTHINDVIVACTPFLPHCHVILLILSIQFSSTKYFFIFIKHEQINKQYQILRMGDIVNFFSGYGAYHHNIVNKWIHILCVPIILYTANGFGEFCQIGNDSKTTGENFRCSKKMRLSA